MATEKFNNRVYGCAVIRSINSNFNADFSHSPRSLPDGTVYATDKALKYAIRDYIRKNENRLVLYMKQLSDAGNVFTLGEAYEYHKKKNPKLFVNERPLPSKQSEKDRMRGINRLISTFNLLRFIDVRLFGATFAVQKKEGTAAENVSIHGPVQINHAINKYESDGRYNEAILSPFRTQKEERASETEENQTSTLGNQTNVQEVHYVYHFSINPKNLYDYYKLYENRSDDYFQGHAVEYLTTDDINIFKEAMTKAVTYLDSSRKIGSENEMALFVTLKKESNKVLPGFTELVDVRRDKDKKVVIDATKAAEVIKSVIAEVEKVELYYNPTDTIVTGFDGMNIERYNLLNSQKI